MKSNFKRNLLIGFGISFFILIVSSTASFISIKNLLESSSLVNHTQEVIYNLNQEAAIFADSQNSMRGYLITGKQEFLNQMSGSKEDAERYYNKLIKLTADNPEQQQNLKDMERVINDFFSYLQMRVQEKNEGLDTGVVTLNNGEKLRNDIVTILKRMENEERNLLNERSDDAQTYGNYSVILIIIAAILSMLISGLYFVRILNDYSERSKLYGELQQKDEETAQRIRIISRVAGQIAMGDYKVKVDESDSRNDSLGSISGSLNNMASSLDAAFTALSEKEWMQAGIAELGQVMIGEKSVEELSKDVIEYLAQFTGSSAGVLYVAEGEDLHYTAGYSYAPDKSLRFIKMGDSLIGQAAASGKVLHLQDIEPKYIKVSHALGEVKPKHIVAVPLMDIKIEGALELASVREYTKQELEFLNLVAEDIGIALKAAQNRKRLQELLEETQAQSEELRTQHTELESMNAELETQTEKLQASEEELRVQQEELQQTNEELSERSTLLEEKNMEIQKKSQDLELTTRYKSEFLANMSHELRTPLNSILLLSRLLSENNDKNMNDEQIEFAKVIQSSGNGLLGLIDEILDLSKIEAGKMNLEFIQVSANEITNNLKDLFAEVAKEKKIEFKIIDDEAPLVIRTDKMRLEQILKNLISNAIKFTSQGSVTLEVKKNAEDEKIIDFIVRDTGIGIPREKQPLIFEAFQQADGSTKRKYGGTGLGLSISRELAKLLNGEITLKSTVNEGSEFTLSIPISGTALVQPDTDEVMVEASEPVEENLKGTKDQYISDYIPENIPDDRDTITEKDKTILIVEDDTNFAKSLLEFTRKRGYKGIVAVRGDHALNLALGYNPVGILLDIQLPIKSGWEVMEDLKGNFKTRHIPVHIMSSHKLKQESLLKGAVNFLDKPVAYEQMPEIFKKIEHIVNKESQKVLIIEDNPKHAKALALFLETYDINSEIKSEITDGITALRHNNVDCVILDMGIPDKQAYEILENVKQNEGLENLPVIVFTGKSLSMKEEVKIKKYADSIVIKTAHSYQRMLDEVSLFLHLVEEKKAADGKKENLTKLNLLNNVLSDKKVLVVDDDVRNIYSLTKALESLKMSVITAIDGKEALKMLEQHPDTDVVLLDMMMPNMDGYETATRIRENARFKNLPVIAVTAKAMTGDREKCINAGASDYITKPVDIDQLLSLLRVWLYDRF